MHPLDEPSRRGVASGDITDNQINGVLYWRDRGQTVVDKPELRLGDAVVHLRQYHVSPTELPQNTYTPRSHYELRG